MKRFFIWISMLTICIYIGFGSMTPAHAGQTDSGSNANYDVMYWESVKDSNNIKMFRAYLKKYPNGMFADLAKIQIGRLESETQNAGSTTGSGDAKLWESVKDSNNIGMFRAYLKTYPNGMFAELAKIQIDRLEKTAKPSAAAHGNAKKSGPAAPLLRSTPIVLEEPEIKKMLKKYNFSDYRRNYNAVFKNDFKDNHDGTVTDRATGLIWEKSGSWRKINRKKADYYIDELNRKKLAGRTNWRIPTAEELASLLENKPSGRNGYYIDPVFDKAENGNWLSICWTSDTLKNSMGADYAAWLVDFKNWGISTGRWFDFPIGSIRPENEQNYVRAVSSATP